MSKLVPHIIASQQKGLQLVDAGAVGVKLVETTDFATYCANKTPRPLITSRPIGGDDLVDFMSDPIQMADNYFNIFHQPMLWNNLPIDVHEGPNERKCDSQEKMTWYGLFEARRAERLYHWGVKAGVGSFATGQPEVNLWPFFRPAIDAVKGYGGFLTLHEYSEPERWYAGDRWYFCRYRMAPRDVPKLITECGLDDIPPVFDSNGNMIYQAGRPWKQYKWRDGRNISEDEYLEFLKSYDNEIKRDSDIYFAAIFTFGGVNWGNHEVADTGLPEKLAAYIRSDTTMKTDYVVGNCLLLNVRGFPWTGVATPPIMRQLKPGMSVHVYDICQLPGMAYGWALISPNGNEWVSMRYLV